MSYLNPIRHILWRGSPSARTPEAAAQEFARFCRSRAVMTRGLVRIGASPNFPGSRGVIAQKNINADETVIAVPDRAFLTAFDVMRYAASSECRSVPRGSPRFSNIFDATNVTNDTAVRLVTRRLGNTFVRAQHMLLAVYLSHAILLDNPVVDPWVSYTDQLPRGEGDFTLLYNVLRRVVESSDPEWRGAITELERQHSITPAESIPLMCYALAMVISRSVPLTQESSVKFIARETDVATAIQRAQDHLRLLPTSEAGQGTPQQPTTSATVQTLSDSSLAVVDGAVARVFPISVMAPVIDMINHEPPDRANVMVAVPDDALPSSQGSDSAATPKNSCLLLVRSLRAISAGEELSMAYGDGCMDASAMELAYGFKPRK